MSLIPVSVSRKKQHELDFYEVEIGTPDTVYHVNRRFYINRPCNQSECYQQARLFAEGAAQALQLSANLIGTQMLPSKITENLRRIA